MATGMIPGVRQWSMLICNSSRPICFDGWSRLDSLAPPWLNYQVKFDDELIETPTEVSQRKPSRWKPRGDTSTLYFRPDGAHLERTKGNRGPTRQPEPVGRPFEGGQQDQTELTIIEGSPASQQELGNAPASCAMYGFGVDWDFTWEDEFHDMTGCETHSFDPSLGLESHYRGRNQWFWNIGLSYATTKTVGTTLRTKQVSEWAVFTLADTMRMLNHSYVSVLKVDVEGYEWDALARAFKDGAMDRVEQVGEKVVRKWKPSSV
ncbi:Methyltransferase-like protein 24 [Gonapodya sp. JEL0774]|nr:Methyltransferase-like protein 24 [Gonapodya sp. JEL0774]